MIHIKVHILRNSIPLITSHQNNKTADQRQQTFIYDDYTCIAYNVSEIENYIFIISNEKNSICK